MRALLVSPTSVAGGAERAFAGLARRLPEFDVEAHAVLLQHGVLEDWLAETACPYTVLRSGRVRQLHKTASTLAELVRHARQADCVVSNQSKGHVLGGLAALIARRPAVWWQQGIPRNSPIECAAARIPAAAVVTSSRDALDAQRRLTPTHRVEMIHLGIDVNSVRTRTGSGVDIRSAYGLGPGPVVGIVGRLQEWKGQDVFLRAAALVLRSHPQVTFLVVGSAVLGWEGDYPDRLQKLARELGIAGSVRFVEHQADVYPWFDAIDVLVHASYGEPFGLVVVEAMALGKAVIATAAGGPVEIIKDGTSGILVPPGDHESMAAAVTKVLDDDNARSGLGLAAAKRAECFDDARMAERFSGILHDVTAHVRNSHCAASGLEERTVPGLHDYVYRHVVHTWSPGAAVDLGAGSGAFAQRLTADGFSMLAVDRVAGMCDGSLPYRQVDLNSAGWAGHLGTGQWSLVTALEVIEHLEAPVAFLRGVADLLSPDGIAVVTTPNVDSLAARAKLLIRGRLRMFDQNDDPTHISPIFWDLLIRQFLPRSGLQLVESFTYPPDGFIAGRPVYRRLLTLARPLFLRHPRLAGDNHILVLAKTDDA